MEKTDRQLVEDKNYNELNDQKIKTIDTLRKLRHGTMYYGKKVGEEFLINYEDDVKNIIETMRSILKEELGYEHLCLPMEFDEKRKCTTSIDFKDPRTHEGELLCPNRIGAEANEALKIALGSYAYAAQMQQTPGARDGNMFKIDELNIIDSIKESNVKNIPFDKPLNTISPQ